MPFKATIVSPAESDLRFEFEWCPKMFLYDCSQEPPMLIYARDDISPQRLDGKRTLVISLDERNRVELRLLIDGQLDTSIAWEAWDRARLDRAITDMLEHSKSVAQSR